MNGSDRAEENFRRALARLEEFLALPQDQAVVQTAVAKAFELSYETAWKLAKRLASEQGQEVESPRAALEAALRLGVLPSEDEDAWLDMPKTRNLAAHVYLPDVSRQVVSRVRQRFLPAFRRFRDGLDAARLES